MAENWAEDRTAYQAQEDTPRRQQRSHDLSLTRFSWPQLVDVTILRLQFLNVRRHVMGNAAAGGPGDSDYGYST